MSKYVLRYAFLTSHRYKEGFTLGICLLGIATTSVPPPFSSFSEV